MLSLWPLHMRRKLLFVITIAAALGACNASDPTPTPPFGLPPLVLPADEAPHDFQAEWWYFNLHLIDEENKRYALHDVVFQVQQLGSNRTLYVRQVGLGDVAGAVHYTSERLRTTDQPLTDDPGDFAIMIGQGELTGTNGEKYRLVGAAGNMAYDLTLTTVGEPVAHDDDGLVDFGEAGITYYYSRPRLEVSGTLVTEREERTVTGLGWLDKQWGDFQPVAVFWDWASVQLDDGTDLMLSNLYDANRRPIEVYATLRQPGQQERRLSVDEFTFEPLADEWHSEKTGTTYKTRWRVEVAAVDLHVTLEPLLVESEFASAFLGVVYWEAGVDVVDAEGRQVGQGFVELNWGRNLAFMN